MANLHIALQDGFQQDTVIIYANGRTVYQKAGVTTNLAISLADTLELEVEKEAVRVEVVVASRDQRASITVNPGQTPYLAIQLGQEGALRLLPSAYPFRYM